MSGTFDERGKGSDSPGKRPAPTIEGTATEVSVEPADDAARTDETKTSETNTSETKTGESETASAELGVADSAEDKTAETETAEDKPGEASDAGVEERRDQERHADPSAEKPGSDERVSDEPGSEDPRPEKSASEAASGDESESGPWQDAAQDGGRETEPVVHSPRAGSEAQDRSFGGRFLGWLAALFTHAVAGVAGGLAVLAALIWGYLPTLPSQDRAGAERIESGIESRIAALESAPKSPDNAVVLENAAALKELKAQLAALESAAKEPTTPAADPAALKALSAQVAQLETALKSLAETAKEGGSVADAAAISQEVAEAERRLDTALQSKVQAEVQSALADRPASSADDETVQALKSEVSGLDAKLKALTEATMDADSAAKLQPEISALARRVDEIETTVPSLLDAIDADNAQVRQAHLAIAFSGLREAVNAGQPYAAELTAMTALSPNPEDLGDLVAYEDTGIPTRRMLAASFVPLRDKVLAEQPGAAPDVVGRLLGSAQSLVTIRRIGEQAEGLGPDAILARAEAKLDAGKLREAVTELQELQGAPANVFKSWIGQARARLDADTALQRLQDVLLVSLAGSGGASDAPDAPAAEPGAPEAREETE